MMPLAIHEAAHFLALNDIGHRPSSLSIFPIPGSDGRVYFTRILFEIVLHERPADAIFCIVVGKMAQNRYTGLIERVNGKDAEDVSYVLSQQKNENRHRIHSEAVQKAERWLDANFFRVQWLANNLMRHDEMTFYDVERIVPNVLHP